MFTWWSDSKGDSPTSFHHPSLLCFSLGILPITFILTSFNRELKIQRKLVSCYRRLLTHHREEIRNKKKSEGTGCDNQLRLPAELVESLTVVFFCHSGIVWSSSFSLFVLAFRALSLSFEIFVRWWDLLSLSSQNQSKREHLRMLTTPNRSGYLFLFIGHYSHDPSQSTSQRQHKTQRKDGYYGRDAPQTRSAT